jgi:hypothetical protein
MCLFAAASQAQPPKKLLLLAQLPDGHPPLTHEYKPGLTVLKTLLSRTPGVQVELVMADEPWRDGPERLAKADGAVVFLSQGAAWLHQDPKRSEAFKALAKRGGGLSVIHWGMGTKDQENVAGFVDLFGGCHGGPNRKYQVVSTDLTLPSADHPAVSGLKPFKAKDEYYYTLWLAKDRGTFSPLVQATIDGKAETVSWAWQRPDGGRSFGFSGLHFHENWSMPEYRRLVTQGVLWTLGLEIPKEGVDVKLREGELTIPPQ